MAGSSLLLLMMMVLMPLMMVVLLLVSVPVQVQAETQAEGQEEVVAEWVHMRFQWEDAGQEEDVLRSGQYVPDNCAVSGIAVRPAVGKPGQEQGNRQDVQEVYLTVPRWRPGVPSTLNKLVEDPTTGAPLLAPYPSWEMQDYENNEDAFSYVQSMKIESDGRHMWVIDNARRNTLSDAAPTVPGPSRLVILDMEHGGDIVHEYVFPDEVAPYNRSSFNDVRVDEDRRVAYITDIGTASIVTYSVEDGQSRAFTGPSCENDPTVDMVINGRDYGTTTFTTPVDGMALSPDFETLFYCALQSESLFYVPTAALRDFSLTNSEIEAQVVQVPGSKPPTGGMHIMGDWLYYGGLTTDSVYGLDVSDLAQLDLANGKRLATNAVTMHWVDSFSPGEEDLFFTTNKLDLFINGTMEFSYGLNGVNFRLVRVPLEG